MRLYRRVGTLLLGVLVLIGSNQAFASLDAIADLEHEAQVVRQLELVTPLETSIVSREQFKEEQKDSFEADIPEQDAADFNALLKFLGYIGENDDIVAIYNNLMSEQILGFYDTETKQLVIVATADQELNGTDKTTVIHETIHALQDQNFDFEALYGGDDNPTDDVAYASLALVEGDATWGEILFIQKNDLLDQILEEYAGMDLSSIDDAPFFLVETNSFPYQEGADFIAYFWKMGGWKAVNEIWSDPPSTTEQILHPEKYASGEEGVPLVLNDPLEVLGGDWRLIDGNTYGEFGIRVFLQNGGASPRQAQLATSGWGGDAINIVTNDSETAMVWNTSWDTEDDAKEFFNTLAHVESGRLRADVSNPDTNTTVLTADGWRAEITIDELSVNYVLAQSETTFELLKRSQVDAQAHLAAPGLRNRTMLRVASPPLWTREP